MFGPTPKYHGQPAYDAQGNRVAWHGHPDGLPVKLPPGMHPEAVIPRAAYENARTTFDFQARMFCLQWGAGPGTTSDLTDYVAVMDRVSNRLALLISREVQWHPTSPGVMFVFLSWVDVYGCPSVDGRTPAIKSAVPVPGTPGRPYPYNHLHQSANSRVYRG